MQKRLFIGTMLPVEDAEKIAEMRQSIEPKLLQWWDCELRWVRPDKLHITWLFLGNCDEASEKKIKEELPKLLDQQSKLQITYEDFTMFGSKGRPNAVVLLPKQLDSAVLELGKRLRDSLDKYREKEDEHKFNPHLTLFRFPRDTKKDYRIEDGLDISKYVPLQQKIEKLSLIESHTGNDGVDYNIISEYALL